MRGLLPQRWTGGMRFNNATVVRDGVAGLVAFSRRGRVESLLGPVVGRRDALRKIRGPVVLALPPSLMLQQSANLPLAAERELPTVLRHEMDRVTPFQADELFWTWRLDRRDRVAGRLHLRLLLVPKRFAADILVRLEAAGLRPSALEIADGSAVHHLSLEAPGSEAKGRRSIVVAASVCAGLAVALCLLPVLRQEYAIAAAETEVASLRPRVALLEALRRRVAANASGIDVLAREDARVGNALQTLALLTAALPDDTVLTSWAMRERTLLIAGRSSSAAKLIGLLSASPALRDPAFDAPVTRVAERGDLFSIRASVAP